MSLVVKGTALPYAKPSAFRKIAKTGAQAPESNVVQPTPSTIPSLRMTIPDHVDTPSYAKEHGLWLPFPLLRRQSNGSILNIKYLSDWRMKEGSRTGNRSTIQSKGYVGYRGKEITFTAVFDDTIFANQYTSTADMLETLRVWSIMEVKKARLRRSINIHVLQLKKQASPEQQMKIIADYLKSSQTSTTGNEAGSKGDLSYKDWITGDPKRHPEGSFESVESLQHPIPPLPLVFSIGTIEIKPCVIKKVSVVIHRYGPDGVTSADAKITLQELLGKSVWNVKDTPKEMILDVSLDPPNAEEKGAGVQPMTRYHFGWQVSRAYPEAR